jgi:hypothetical protein
MRPDPQVHLIPPEKRHYNSFAAVVPDLQFPSPDWSAFHSCAGVPHVFLAVPRFAVRRPLNVMNVRPRLVRNHKVPAPYRDVSHWQTAARCPPCSNFFDMTPQAGAA